MFICSTGQMSGHITILMFLKEVSYAHQASIYLIKNTDKNSNIVKYYYNKKWFVLVMVCFNILYIYFCYAKLNFHQPLLQS